MRSMPTADKVSLNVNDRLYNGKYVSLMKQNKDVNQHWMHHYAVLPDPTVVKTLD